MKYSLIVAAMAAALPFVASAADSLSYNHVEAHYAKTEAGRAGDADGWGLKASYAVHPNVHVFADGTHQKVSESQDKRDAFRVGAGFNHEIATSTDFIARAAYNRYDTGKALNFNGYSVETGLRTAFGEHIEVLALAGYEDYSRKHAINPPGRTYGRLGGQVKLNQNWGLGGDLKMYGHGGKEWTVGPRLSW